MGQLYSGGRSRKTGGKKRAAAGAMAFLAGMALLCALLATPGDEKSQEKGRLQKKAVLWLQEQTGRAYMPVFAFVEEETGMRGGILEQLGKYFLSGTPLLAYGSEQENGQIGIEDKETHDLLIRQEGSDEERKELEDGSLEYDQGALHIDSDLHKAMQDENSRHSQVQEEADPIPEERPEDTGGFQKALKKSYEYNWGELKEYEDIVSAFYAIDNTTSVSDQRLNLENLLGKDMRVSGEGSGEGYQILIYHTHSQEGFVDSVKGDPSTTIVGAGEKLARLLEENYGFRVLHHTGEYDVEARDYAYSNSLPAISQVLARNPEIQVVIDLHRDAVAEGRKLVVDLDGRPTAQFMFFNGLSRTRENGDISYLENPYIDHNLAFSFQAQVACNEYYPGLARRIYLKAYRYNMHLRAQCMLVELGAQTNTVEEIMNAVDPLAHVIAKVLSGETGDQAREAAGIELDNGG
ncbi:MAG: stage II sporulation protein P [Lachnospiraceae bacterium]|nr:stage II sporulation protein P [Lachnospiraceae bacterium]